MGDPEPLFSATLFLDQLGVMRELYGNTRVDEAIAALPEAVRRELAELVPGGWCNVSSVTAMKSELARRIGDGPLALQRRVVARGMERTLNGFWRFFLARLSDPWILKFAPLVYSKSFDRGSLVVEKIDAGQSRDRRSRLARHARVRLRRARGRDRDLPHARAPRAAQADVDAARGRGPLHRDVDARRSGGRVSSGERPPLDAVARMPHPA